jgi:outer membrane protein, heavy metal efflux system
VAAARAEVEAARRAVDRTRVMLRLRLAEAYKGYANALTAAKMYREEMIPAAEKAHAMYRENYRRMAAAYPFALQAQRSLVQLREEYVDALVMGWQRAVEIEGLLVEGLLR